jgi:hypothetical protein
MKAKSSKTRRSNLPLKLIVLIVLLCILAAALIYWLRHNSHKTQPLPQPAKGTTSKVTPHHEAPVNISNQQGGVIDQKGKVTDNIPPSSSWVTSSSGNITLQQPTAGQVLRSGDTISGITKVSTVQFILKDNSVGVISQGTMNVVNGKFSGTLEFRPHSSKGELEVFYPSPSTGAEQDIINIDVNYST